MNPEIEPQREIVDEPPPLLRRWPRLYAVVLVYLAFLIFISYLFTRAYAP